jgi:hypothetical protein
MLTILAVIVILVLLGHSLPGVTAGDGAMDPAASRAWLYWSSSSSRCRVDSSPST